MLTRLMLRPGLMFLILLPMKAQHVPPPTPKPATAAVEVVYLTPYGFFPKQFAVTHGRHLLIVKNATGLRNPSLNVSLGGLGPTVPPVQTQQTLTTSNPHWLNLLDLPAGQYTLTEATHPTWTCTITVQ